jgi:hypothetical protein
VQLEEKRREQSRAAWLGLARYTALQPCPLLRLSMLLRTLAERRLPCDRHRYAPCSSKITQQPPRPISSHLVSSQPSDQLPRPLHWLELVPAIALQLDDAGFVCMRAGDAQGDKVCVAGRGGRGRVGAIGSWFGKGGTGMGWWDGWMDE